MPNQTAMWCPDFVLLLLLIRHVDCASEFNEAFAASVVANVEQLVAVPWSRVLNVLKAAFNSRWSYVYSGDNSVLASGPDGYIQYVSQNHTQEYLWALFKGFSYDDSSSVDMIYAGFENGMFIGYSNPSPGELYLEENGNMSCPDWNITQRCRATYGGDSTSIVSGAISGPVTFAKVYDPRWRPWYTDSEAGGSIWTDPYAFAEYNVLGVTAAMQIVTDEGQFIGVFGADYTLGSIGTVLVSQVEDNEEFVIFIVDNKGLLIAASIDGVAVSAELTQIPANESSVEVIASVAQFMETDKSSGGVGGWVAANGTVYTIDISGEGLYWAQSTELRDSYGLHWHVVVAELVSCDVGFYTPPQYKGVDCKECFKGGECPGGSSLPYTAPGYWIDRSKYSFGDKAYECSWETCLGFEQRAKRLTSGDVDDTYSSVLYDCWSEASFNASQCQEDDLMCASGSTGPLCGSCKADYTYNSALRSCVKCNSQENVIPAAVVLSLVGLVGVAAVAFILKDSPMCGGDGFAATMKNSRELFQYFLAIPPFSVLKHVDRGMLKVVWATCQIIGTISWNIGIRYPEPFDSLLSYLSFLQLDFFALDCQDTSANFITRVYVLSIVPIVLSLVCLAVYFIRCCLVKNSDEEADALLNITNQHLYFFLLLGFLVLPTVSMIQFSALECVTFDNGSSYLRADTSIDCNGNSYKNFQVVDILSILVYQSIPLLWFVLLFRQRDRLNPQGAAIHRQNRKPGMRAVKRGSVGRGANPRQRPVLSVEMTASSGAKTNILLSDHEKSIVRGRNGDPAIQHLAFLWKDYVPARWYYEVFEMYRRILFIAAIPLIGTDSALRATMGCLLSIVMVGFVREASPFLRGATNVLLSIAQYQILITFFGAFILITGALSSLGLSRFALGCLLLGVNVVIMLLVGGWSLRRYWYELKAKRWRKALNDKELDVLNRVMEENDGGELHFKRHEDEHLNIWDKAKSVGRKMRVSTLHLPNLHLHTPNHQADVEMKRKKEEEDRNRAFTFLDPNHLDMQKKIGAGSFGEVFKGTYQNKAVAIKTMITITEKTAHMFKGEIVLHSKLNHPNIVNFVGACWSRQLTCLVLEWVPGGTLGELMEGERNHTLKWDEPLLKLALEMAEGMRYLHGIIPAGAANAKDMILHRDLKPENVLITEYVSAKITDFGTSRAKETNAELTMTAVGTPLYCAPEIVKGEQYDEKVDVYAFGLILMDMAIEDTLISFIGERWRLHFRRKAVPKQAMRFIRAMTEDGWRPVGQAPPPAPVKKTMSVVEDQEAKVDAMTLKMEESAEQLPIDLPETPKSIEALVVKCIDHDSFKRPSFIEIVKMLGEECTNEVMSGECFVNFAPPGKLKNRVSSMERSASQKSSSSLSRTPSSGPNSSRGKQGTKTKTSRNAPSSTGIELTTGSHSGSGGGTL